MPQPKPHQAQYIVSCRASVGTLRKVKTRLDEAIQPSHIEIGSNSLELTFPVGVPAKAPTIKGLGDSCFQGTAIFVPQSIPDPGGSEDLSSEVSKGTLLMRADQHAYCIRDVSRDIYPSEGDFLSKVNRTKTRDVGGSLVGGCRTEYNDLIGVSVGWSFHREARKTESNTNLH